MVNIGMRSIYHHQLEHRNLAYSWSHSPSHQPLVVVHGLGDSAIHTYAPRFASTALRDTPSLFIDLPGFGEADADDCYPATIEVMADDVANLLYALEIRDTPIFAHSMGANIAIVLAHRYPELVSGLIVAEPLLDPDHSVLAAGIAKHSEHSFVSRRHAMLVRATSLQMRRGNVAAAAFLPTLKMANPAIMHRAAASLIRERNPGSQTLLCSLRVHYELMMGEHTVVDTTGLEQAGIPVVRVKDAGHSMMVEQDESTAYVILTLVNRVHYDGN